ncbi:MAG: DUF5615 family PIN-like protein [Chloroflexi bacterium]|nr:DUF5615 family PIN-like protein [Chloroflexota bacterium]
MARLYANENFPFQVVRALRDLGHDVLTSLDAGKANQSIPDNEVLLFATQEKRALLTINRRDFIPFHQGVQHAEIIVCTQDGDIDGQASRIHTSIQSVGSIAGQLLRVNRPQRNKN